MSRLSQTSSVVNTAYGDRQIIDLPDLGQRSTEYVPSITQQHVLRQHRKEREEHRANRRSTDYQNLVTHRSTDYQNQGTVPSLLYYQPNLQTMQYQPLPTYMTDQNGYLPNYVSSTNLVDPRVMYQPHSQYNYLPYGTTINRRSQDIHLYYGPNGEQLPGSPSEFTGYSPATNFTIEGTLEYGKLVSVKFRRGNISFREIPEFLLTHLLKTFKNVAKAHIVVISEDGKYHLYSPSLKRD